MLTVLSGCGQPATPSATSSPTARSAGASLTTIHIALPDAASLTGLDLVVAQQFGFFRKHGLTSQIVTMKEPTAVAALSKGSINFIGVPDFAANGAEKGLPMRVVAVTSTNLDEVLVGGKGITSFSQLSHRTVVFGGARSTIVTGIARLILRGHGLLPGSYKPTYAPAPEAAAMLLHGLAAASVMDLPTAIRLEPQGYSILASYNEFPSVAAGLAANVNEIRHQPALVRNAIASILQAANAIKGDKQRMLTLLEQHYHLPSAVAKQAYTHLVKGLVTSGEPASKVLKFTSSMDARDLKLKVPPRTKSVYDFSLLRTA